MKYQYVMQQEGNYWNVWFTQCPGCQTFGESPSHALEMAREALTGWLFAHDSEPDLVDAEIEEFLDPVFETTHGSMTISKTVEAELRKHWMNHG